MWKIEFWKNEKEDERVVAIQLWGKKGN